MNLLLDHIAGLDRTADGFKVRKVNPDAKLPDDVLDWLKKHKPFICAAMDAGLQATVDGPTPAAWQAEAREQQAILRKYRLSCEHVAASLEHHQREQYKAAWSLADERGLPMELCDVLAAKPYVGQPKPVAGLWGTLTSMQAAERWANLVAKTGDEANVAYLAGPGKASGLTREFRDLALMENDNIIGICHASRYYSGELSGILWKSLEKSQNGKYLIAPVWGYDHALMGEHLLNDYFFEQETGIRVVAQNPEVYLCYGVERLHRLWQEGCRAVGGLFHQGNQHHKQVWASRIQHLRSGMPPFKLANADGSQWGKDSDDGWEDAIKSVAHNPKGFPWFTTTETAEVLQ